MNANHQQNTQPSAADDLLVDGIPVSVRNLSNSNTNSNMHASRRRTRALSVTTGPQHPQLATPANSDTDTDDFSSSASSSCTSECESINDDHAVDDDEDDDEYDEDMTDLDNKHSSSSLQADRPMSLPLIPFSDCTNPASLEDASTTSKKLKSRSRSMSELNKDVVMPPFKIHKHVNSDSLSYKAGTEAKKKHHHHHHSHHHQHHTQHNKHNSSTGSSSMSELVVPSSSFSAPVTDSSSSSSSSSSTTTATSCTSTSTTTENIASFSNGPTFKLTFSSTRPQQVTEYASQPPPVNSMSLKEIDLQEIFKNPQLRHDIVFDPQLQFRPNLDGERGRRKRSMAEKYWESIVMEFEELLVGYKQSQVFHSEFVSFPPPPPPVTRHDNNSRLPLLFTTLKEILISLLPTKDRNYADSVLDCDLIMQQLRKNSLDFLSLATWLAQIFKAHCAPMRDSWVDQMVSRIELGVNTQSPKRLVEGLRMIFAILEAMKLDVANHQIRTLRPLLVSSAVEFEQGYYSQYASRGKLLVSDSLQWFADCTEIFKNEAPSSEPIDINKQAFLFGFLRLITCSGVDIVSEFPSAFSFDTSRLSSLRAELRKIVCLNLCVLLYQQMLKQANSSGKLSSTEVSKAVSLESLAKLKHDVIAIVSDSTGNLKWTKNTSSLGLELAKRVSNLVNNTNSFSSSQQLSNFATTWLAKQLQPKSELYILLEKRARRFIFEVLAKNMTLIRSLDYSELLPLAGDSKKQALAVTTVLVEAECMALASRMIVLSRFHWAVFGKQYVSHVSSCKSTDESNVKEVQMRVENDLVEVSEQVEEKTLDVRSKQVKC